jgi:hypothetical protein
VVWQDLQKLRDLYNSSNRALARDYWVSYELLDAYDQTLGARIGWKWASVFSDLPSFKGLGANGAKTLRIADWGCGTAVATRQLLENCEKLPVGKITLIDRSAKAMEYGESKVREAGFDGLVSCEVALNEKVDILLISHVINELTPQARSALRKAIKLAQIIMWVEPGAKLQSQELAVWREQLIKKGAKVIAPCPHQKRCPLLPEKNQKPADWCHTFARVPDEVGQSSHWAKVADYLHIDIRSVPLSFLVVGREQGEGLITQQQASREFRIGREYKKRLLVCRSDGRAHKVDL